MAKSELISQNIWGQLFGALSKLYSMQMCKWLCMLYATSLISWHLLYDLPLCACDAAFFLSCPRYIALRMVYTWYGVTFSTLAPRHLVFLPWHFLGGCVPCFVLGTSHPFIVALYSVCLSLIPSCYIPWHLVLVTSYFMWLQFPVSLYIMWFCINLVSFQYIRSWLDFI